jgi:hypothetical protein
VPCPGTVFSLGGLLRCSDAGGSRSWRMARFTMVLGSCRPIPCASQSSTFSTVR